MSISPAAGHSWQARLAVVRPQPESLLEARLGGGRVLDPRLEPAVRLAEQAVGHHAPGCEHRRRGSRHGTGNRGGLLAERQLECAAGHPDVGGVVAVAGVGAGRVAAQEVRLRHPLSAVELGSVEVVRERAGTPGAVHLHPRGAAGIVRARDRCRGCLDCEHGSHGALQATDDRSVALGGPRRPDDRLVAAVHHRHPRRGHPAAAGPALDHHDVPVAGHPAGKSHGGLADPDRCVQGQLLLLRGDARRHRPWSPTTGSR